MASSPIRRSNYAPPDVGFDCLNRGAALDADFANYHAPLAELRNQALRGPGVAAGLELAGAIGAAGLTLAAGVAIDALGRTIVLPQTDGAALVETAPGAAHASVPFQDAVNIPTQAAAGSWLLTIEFHEELINKYTDVAPCKSWEQRPIIRFRPAAPLDPASAEVVLGTVVIDAAGLVQRLSSAGRTTSQARLGSIQFRRSVDLTNNDADRRAADQDGGSIACQSDGSLRVAAPSLQVDGDLAVGGDLRPAGSILVPDARRRRVYHFPLWAIHPDPSGPMWEVFLRNSLRATGNPAGRFPLSNLPNGARIDSLTIRSTASQAGTPALIGIALSVLDHQTGALDESRRFMIQAGDNLFDPVFDPIIVENNRYSYDLFVTIQRMFAPTQSVTIIQDISINYEVFQLY